MTIDEVLQLAASRRVRITLHARTEMDADEISTDELISSLVEKRCEIVETYEDDPRGASQLLLARTLSDEPLHVCCAIHEDQLVIITVYRPRPERWGADWKKRR